MRDRIFMAIATLLLVGGFTVSVFSSKRINCCSRAVGELNGGNVSYSAATPNISSSENLQTYGFEDYIKIRWKSPANRYHESNDSDRDSIPDENDPLPNDFTNDGTLDSEMVTEDGFLDIDGTG